MENAQKRNTNGGHSVFTGSLNSCQDYFNPHLTSWPKFFELSSGQLLPIQPNKLLGGLYHCEVAGQVGQGLEILLQHFRQVTGGQLLQKGVYTRLNIGNSVLCTCKREGITIFLYSSRWT